MDTEIFQDWMLKDSTTAEQVRQARTIVDFLDWAFHQEGKKSAYVNEGGYSFRRSVSVYGSHEDEIVEDDELAKLVIRFLEEER
jgi:hypothetical protein